MGENRDGNTFSEERKREIAVYVKEQGRVSVAQLCEKFSVSPATMRNDLQVLHERGLLKRTHGGALANTQANFEPSTNEKYEKFLAEKQAIARAALQYIHEGDSIALDAGTTTYELAKLLGQFRNLRVVTYDLNIAAYLDANTETELFVAGGEVRRGHHYMIGNGVMETVGRLHVDLFFMGANGISIKTGVTTPQPETAVIKEQIMRNARQRILLADSSKLENISFVKFADLEDVSVFITDDRGDREMLEQLRGAGVKVDTAPL